jgi:hypothetical protein
MIHRHARKSTVKHSLTYFLDCRLIIYEKNQSESMRVSVPASRADNWNQVEVYVRDHTEAEFSHSICTECMKILYPEFTGDKTGGKS